MSWKRQDIHKINDWKKIKKKMKAFFFIFKYTETLY